MMDVPQDIRMSNAINASKETRKFSDNIVSEIKYKKSIGYTYKQLMDEYNISSKGTLWYILNTEYKTVI